MPRNLKFDVSYYLAVSVHLFRYRQLEHIPFSGISHLPDLCILLRGQTKPGEEGQEIRELQYEFFLEIIKLLAFQMPIMLLKAPINRLKIILVC